MTLREQLEAAAKGDVLFHSVAFSRAAAVCAAVEAFQAAEQELRAAENKIGPTVRWEKAKQEREKCLAQLVDADLG